MNVNREPRISIITVCKNARNALIDTIESVRAQRYPNIEYIVVDGASTDGTLEIADQFRDVINVFVSEDDSGIFEAMNKGAKLASGEFLLYLNAGDTLLRPETIEAVVGAIGRSKDADVYHGDIVIFDPESGQSVYHSAKEASRVSLFRGAMSHQAMLIRKSTFEKVGPYEQSFLIGGDYEWSLRAFHNFNLRFNVIRVCVSVFMLGGLSSTEQHQQTMHDEFRQCRSKYYSKIDTLKIRTIVRFHKIFGI
jgi:glycosyltransferase involved in cell wall biosynthesis